MRRPFGTIPHPLRLLPQNGSITMEVRTPVLLPLSKINWILLGQPPVSLVWDPIGQALYLTANPAAIILNHPGSQTVVCSLYSCVPHYLIFVTRNSRPLAKSLLHCMYFVCIEDFGLCGLLYYPVRLILNNSFRHTFVFTYPNRCYHCPYSPVSDFW